MGTPHPPIDRYGLLSDTHTAALLAPDGAIEWMCVPAFDGASVFGALLDRERGGSLRLEVAGGGLPTRRYLDDTLVLESRYEAPDATVTVVDFLALRDHPPPDPADPHDPLRAEHILVRLVRTSGPAEVRVRVDARPDYARDLADWFPAGDGCWQHATPGMWLSASRPLRLGGGPDSGPDGAGDSKVRAELRAEVRLAGGEAVALALGYADSKPRPMAVSEAERLLRQTRRVWQRWSGRSDYDGVGRTQVRHSAMVLRALAFDESGALLAAPTTSLPEEVGGERNWDYRFTWYRDAALLLLSLFRLGHQEEGARYLRFLLRACAADPDRPPPLVAIDGKHDLNETVLERLAGYRGSRPVRIGNQAYQQTQLDSYGHLLDAALAYQQVTGALRPDEWRTLRRYVDQTCHRWREPDHGIWEIRGEQRHYVNSKVMSWVCLDRGVRLARLLGDQHAATDRWARTAGEVHREVLRYGYDQQRGSFVQAYDSPVADASLLRLPLVGFLPGDDPRVVGTVDRIARELAVPGTPLVHRYEHAAVDDRLSGVEGAFLLCSFELVSALVLAGRHDDARERFDDLCRRCGPLGLYSEQIDGQGTALGNYPQALSHLGLIEAAVNLDAAGSTEALHAWAADRGQLDR